MRVRLDSVGCRLNIGEMQDLARQLAAAGHVVVGPGEPADLCVFNTCTVTAEAARKSRHAVRQLRRSNPDATVVATGCYAEMATERVREMGVDLVVGNRDKDRLPEVLGAAGLLSEPDAVPSPDATPYLEPGDSGRTRAFLKVQDGCDNRCTFCIVTSARGAGRSRPADTVVTDVRQLVTDGFREVVLSGVHLGSWGHDLGHRPGLPLLVRRLLEETEIERLRLSSLEPWDLDDAFFELLAEPRLLPHLHLPLQSGCEATLRRMARRTSQEEFARLVDSARRAAPDVSISTDVMVGFPGETEEEFAESAAFVEAMRFSRLHVFRYSARRGTAAAAMPGQVPAEVRRERSRRMHALGADLQRAFHRRFLGRTMPVLWETAESVNDGTRWSGLTGNYIRVVAHPVAAEDLHNRVTSARLQHLVPGGVSAVPVT